MIYCKYARTVRVCICKGAMEKEECSGAMVKTRAEGGHAKKRNEVRPWKKSGMGPR